MQCYNRFDLHSNIFHHTRTGRIYDCQWSGNRPRKWSTPGQILVHKGYRLTTQNITPKGGETFGKPYLKVWPPSSGNHSHRIINGWVNRRHHHHNVRWRKLDRTRKKWGSLGHPYTITTTTAIRTPETRWYSLRKATCRGVATIRARNMPSMGHTHSLLESIPTKR